METLFAEKTAYEIERNKPMPSRLHSQIQSRLNGIFYTEYSAKYEACSELTLRLPQAPQDFVPDLSIYAVDTLPTGGLDDVQVTIAPLCVVEIISPPQSLYELVQKINGYFQYGVQSAWLVVPEMQNIFVYTAPQQYEMFHTPQTLIDEKLDIKLDLKKIF